MRENINYPEISVVMSVYNGENYLHQSLESILSQTFRNFEFIIINDGSTDGSKRILHSYASKDNRIRLIEQQNTGLTIALRKGVEAATGQIIARMDADDISAPHRFENQIKLLKDQPALIGATCYYEEFQDDGSFARISANKEPAVLIPLLSCFTNRIGGHGQVMFRRSVYNLVGGYDPNVRYAQDYDLWTRMMEYGNFGVVEDVLYHYRMGHDCITTTAKPAQDASAVQTARRQFHSLAGETISEETARALRDFWAVRDLKQHNLLHVAKAAIAGAKVSRAFFNRHPEIAGTQAIIARLMADRWHQHFSKTKRWNIALKLIFLANYIFWERRSFRKI